LNDATQSQTAVTEYSLVESGLAELRSRLQNVVYEVATTAGMEKARTDRRECVKLRVSLEGLRVGLKTKVLERGRLIDGEAKRIQQAIESLETPIDEQIRKREAEQEAVRLAKAKAEAERVEGIQRRIDGLVAAPADAIGNAAEELAITIKELTDQLISPELYAEFYPRAEAARATAIAKISAMHTAAVANEREAARLAAERADFERQQRDAADKATVEALERSEVARQERERRAEAARVAKIESDALASREKAVRDEESRQAAVAAQQKAAADAADQRLKDEAAKIASKVKADQDEADRLAKIKKKRAAEVAKARKIYDSPEAALRGIFTVCRDQTYSDLQARQEISVIAEGHLPAEAQS
jgi:hypothetical protein